LIDIIPIKLRPCALPDTLKHISYLDVSHLDKNQATERILQAVTKDTRDEPVLPPQVQRNMVTNGSYFNIKSKRSIPGCSSFLDTTVEDMKIGSDVRAIPFNDDEIADTIDKINNSLLMRYNCVLHCNSSCLPDKFTSPCVAIFTSLVIFFCGGLFLLLAVTYQQIDQFADELGRCISVLLSDLIVLMLIILTIGLPLGNTLLKIHFRNKLTNLSVKCVNRNVIFTVTYKDKIPILAVMKYDNTLCLEHIVNEKLVHDPELDTETYKLQVMKKHLCNYALSIQSGTQKATVVRHVVVYEQMCFCQYVQQYESR
ncbi:unnamed protein product, partial [Owenia fusiformis]